jgi:hypothetical protein
VGDDAGYYIEPGFSGAPIWDLGSRAVVGMVTARERDRTIRVAFMLPVEAIQQAYPDVHLLSIAVPFAELTTGIERVASPAGVEQFLLEYLGTPAHPVVFGGRDAVFEELDSWFDSGASFGAIFAPAGRGKSALLARWADYLISSKRADVIFVPVSLRFRTSSRDVVLGILGARLRTLFGVRADLPSSPQGWLLEIERLLREHRDVGTPPLIVIIDGLDEAVAWDPTAEIRLPAQLGQGVKVLVSGRLLANRGEAEWLESLGLAGRARTFALPRLDREAIRAVLGATGAPSFALKENAIVDELVRLTEGDPLLLKLYIDDLSARGSDAGRDLPAEVPGLTGFLDRWWREQRTQWGADSLSSEKRARTMLDLLSCANAPLSAGDVGALTVGYENLAVADVELALASMARLIIGDGTHTPYVFSHSRLSSYFFDLLSQDLDRLRNFESRYIAYGARVVQALREGTLAPDRASPYILEQYSAHLERTNGALAHFAEILDLSWMRARERREGTLEGFAKDAGALLNRTRRVDELAIDSNAIGMQVRAVMAVSSIESVARTLPPSFVRALVTARLWSPEQAFAYARQATSVGLTSCTLGAIADLLPPRLVVDAANLIHHDDNGWYRTQALRGLLPALLSAHQPELAARALTDFDLGNGDTWMDQGEACLLLAATAADEGDSASALLLLDFIRNPWSKAIALGALAPHLAPAEQAKAVDSARRMEYNHGLGLMCLAVVLNEEVGRQLLDEALTALEERDVGVVFSMFAERSWLTPQDLLAALSRAKVSDEVAGRVRWEAALLDAAMNGRAEDALGSISLNHLLFNHEFFRLVERCPEVTRERVLHAALDAVPSSADDLLILAALADGPTSIDLFGRGLKALESEVRSASNRLDKYRRIETLLKYFPGRRETPGRENGLARALAARGLSLKNKRIDLLARLVEKFPVEFGSTVLSLLQEMAGDGSYDAKRGYGEVLAMLGPYLGERELEIALKLGLSFESRSSWLWDVLHDQDSGREAAVSGLAPYLPPRLLRLTLSALRTVPVTSDERYSVCQAIAGTCATGSPEAWQLLSRLEAALKVLTLKCLRGPLDPCLSEMAIAKLGELAPQERPGVVGYILKVIDVKHISETARSALVMFIQQTPRGEERTAALLALAAAEGDRSLLWTDVRAALTADSVGYILRGAIRDVARHLPKEMVLTLLDLFDEIEDLAVRIEVRADLLDHATLTTAERQAQRKHLQSDSRRVKASEFSHKWAVESAIKRLVERGETAQAERLFKAVPRAARKKFGLARVPEVVLSTKSSDASVEQAANGDASGEADGIADNERLWAIASGHHTPPKPEGRNLLERVGKAGRAGETLRFFRERIQGYSDVRVVGAACTTLAPFLTHSDLDLGLELVDLFFHSHGSLFWPGPPIIAILARVAELEGFEAARVHFHGLPEWELVKAYDAMLHVIPDGKLLDILKEVLSFTYDSDDETPLVDGLAVLTPRLCALSRHECVEAWHMIAHGLLNQRRSTAVRAIQAVAPLLVAIGGESTPLRVAEHILDVLPWFASAENVALHFQVETGLTQT